MVVCKEETRLAKAARKFLDKAKRLQLEGLRSNETTFEEKLPKNAKFMQTIFSFVHVWLCIMADRFL